MKSVVIAALLVASITSSAGRASADDNRTDFALTFARQTLPADSSPTSTVAQSKVIYLNKGGITLSPGDNDSRTNKSTLITRQTVIPAWNTDATMWSDTVECMRELFAPFDVTIVTADPGPNVQHIEAVFGGSPSVMDMDQNISGVAPFKSDCSILEDAIVFTFTSNIPQDARTACEVMAQEVAHAYGLDHERLPADPLTYMRYDGHRSFQNQLAECGEDKARVCGAPHGGTCYGKQNSVEKLFAALGAKAAPGDTTPPTVQIMSPADGATVAPGFEIKINAADNARVTMASIFVDGVASGSASVAPFDLKAPDRMVQGLRTIEVEVTDGRQKKRAMIRVNVQGDATDPPEDLAGGCSTGGNASLWFALMALVGSRRCARSRSRRAAAASAAA
jgi:hypothetical protein